MHDLAVLIGVDVSVQIDRLMADRASELAFFRTTGFAEHKRPDFPRRTGPLPPMCGIGHTIVKQMTMLILNRDREIALVREKRHHEAQNL
jgi:hypothetical protein